MNDSTLADFTKGNAYWTKMIKQALPSRPACSGIVKRIVKEMIVSSHGPLLPGLLLCTAPWRLCGPGRKPTPCELPRHYQTPPLGSARQPVKRRMRKMSRLSTPGKNGKDICSFESGFQQQIMASLELSRL